VDNVCHTLVGAAFGEAGLKRRTRYANATLMIASNLPDLDVLVFLTSEPAISFRRGWTHGVVAQALLPAALAGLVYLVGKWRLGRALQGDRPPLHFGWLLALAYIGVSSHVFLDFLNNYGIRLLAPLDWRWFYGDAVFIVDLFLWIALGTGIWLARRRGTPVFARGALIFAAGYIVVMLVSARAARGIVVDVWRDARGTEPYDLMVGPLPLTPFSRVAIVDAGDRYEIGTFRWWPMSVTFEPMSIPKNHTRPEVARAREQSRLVREFLVWSRFPAWTVTPTPQGSQVTVIDLRFMSRPVSGATFQATTVVPKD
jgi:inner membrane protein